MVTACTQQHFCGGGTRYSGFLRYINQGYYTFVFSVAVLFHLKDDCLLTAECQYFWAVGFLRCACRRAMKLF
jgi:hypothetical protein